MRGLVMALAAVVLAAGVLVGTGVAAPPSFSGTWVATDVDGSNMAMTVLGSGSPLHLVVWVDDDVSVCGGGAGLLTAVTTVTGNKMTGLVSIVCGNGNTPTVNNVEVTWKVKGDTLNDSVGVTWSRA